MDTNNNVNFRNSNLENIKQSLDNYGRPFIYSPSLKHRNSSINPKSVTNNSLDLGMTNPLIKFGEVVRSPNIQIKKFEEEFIQKNSNLSTNNSKNARLSNFYNSYESNNNNTLFYNTYSRNSEIRQKKNNVLLAVKKFTLKKNSYEIITYVLDKIYEDGETIKLLYNLIKILEKQPINSNKLNHLNRLKFIEEYISTEFQKINTAKNLSVIDQKYKILIQFFKSVYFIKISTNKSEEYQKNKKNLFNLINYAKNLTKQPTQTIEDNYKENNQRKRLSGENLNLAKKNAKFAKLDKNANFYNQTIALTSKLAYPMNREGFLDFTNIEYFIYSSATYGILTEYNDLIEKSPFYYANGLFHINPIATSLFEKYKPSLEEYIKKQRQSGLESISDYQNKNYIGLENLMHSINKLNNSKHLSTLFEQNFIYNVQFKSPDFQTNFYTMCQEFNFCIDSICICKKDSNSNELEIFDSYQTTKESPLEKTKRKAIFKIDLSNTKQSGGNKVTKSQTGGAIDIIACLYGASFVVSLLFAVGHCTFRKEKTIFPENYSLCIAATTFTFFTIIAGGLLMIFKIVFWGTIILVISSPVLVPFGLFHSFKYIARKIRYHYNPVNNGQLTEPLLIQNSNNISNIKLSKNNDEIIKIEVKSNNELNIIIYDQNKLNSDNRYDKNEIINDSKEILKLIFNNIFKRNQEGTSYVPYSKDITNKIISLCKSLNTNLNELLDTVVITNNNNHHTSWSIKSINYEKKKNNSRLLPQLFI